MKVVLYALLDPRDGRVRYVGKTRRTLAARLTAHLAYVRRYRDTTPRCAWLRELAALGLRPWIVGLREVEAVGADLAERALIAAYPDLLNVTYNLAAPARAAQSDAALTAG